MSPQKENTTTKQAQEPPMVVEDNQWTLGNPTTTSRTESQSALTATNTDIWQKSAEQRRKNGKQGHALNATRRSILPKTAEGNK